MDNSVLYNCCTDHAEPDWSQFNWLEIGGCIDVAEGGEETCIEGGYGADEAEFFCVYGHLKSGGLEDITDCQTIEEARAVANHLEAKTGLPVNITC